MIELKAVNCQNGQLLAQEQLTAAGREKVIDTLGEAASRLRGALGESLANIQRSDVPLSQSTTSSLEALKALSLGKKIVFEKGVAAGIPYVEHAIELDPEFASAYVNLGKALFYIGEYSQAQDSFIKAYGLRERASEDERFDIESMYYQFATGDLDNAVRVFREWLGSNPQSPVALGNLARVYSSMGRYQQSLELNREAQRIRPYDVIAYAGCADVLFCLNRFSEARAEAQAAFDKKLDTMALHLLLYELDFLEGNSQGMAEQVAWSNTWAEPMQHILPLQAAAEAYVGHLHKSVDLNRQAIRVQQRDGKKGGPPVQVMTIAVREALFENFQEARQEASSIPQTQLGIDGTALAALPWQWQAIVRKPNRC